MMWDDAEGYESYVGRWSRAVGPLFADWLAIGPRRRWLDVACGTGALLEAVHDRCTPAALAGIDRSSGYLDYARRRLPPAAARLHLGDAERLPFRSGVFDVVVSGLALNFMDAPAALAEQRRVAARNGVVGAYVWDYAGGYELVRRFWDAAAGVDAEATRHDPGRRFSICNAEALAGLFRGLAFTDVDTGTIEGIAEFPSFEAYWRALDVRQGSLAVYLAALDDDKRDRIRQRLKATTPAAAGGIIRLKLRAFAVRGRVPALPSGHGVLRPSQPGVHDQFPREASPVSTNA